MDKFLGEYDGVSLRDDVTANSPDVKNFSRKFKGYLKRSMGGCTIVEYSLGHYYIRGFLRMGGSTVFFSYNIPRRGKKISVSDKELYGGVMYCACYGPRDTGPNRLTSLERMPKDIIDLLTHMEHGVRV